MMRASIVTALLLLPAAVSPATEPPWLRPMERQAEALYQLPGGLLGRVRAYEGGKDVVRRRRAGLMCGPYQIWSEHSYRTCGFARGPAGVWMAAQLLAESASYCKKRNCPCQAARWNWGDRNALCKALDE